MLTLCGVLVFVYMKKAVLEFSTALCLLSN